MTVMAIGEALALVLAIMATRPISAEQWLARIGLVAALAPRPVWILDPVTPMGVPALAASRESTYAVAARAYQFAGTAESLRWQPARASGEDAAGFYRRLFR